MNDTDAGRKRLETEAIIIGYVMSRMDEHYLEWRQVKTWRDAYKEASEALHETPYTFKNLRDEFDPFHNNPRKGWHQRAIRASRQRVLEEFSGVSDDALMEFVSRILIRDVDEITEAIDVLASIKKPAANVAERLLTGRLAEEYFLAHCQNIVLLERHNVIDCRNLGCGFDFRAHDADARVFEVKGLKKKVGDIQFTDREWQESDARGDKYNLVIVGNLEADPIPRLIKNPRSNIQAQCSYQTTIAATWRARVSCVERSSVTSTT